MEIRQTSSFPCADPPCGLPATLRTLNVARGDGPADLAFAAGPDSHRLISGELAPDRAIATGVIDVLHRRGAPLGRLASTFHLAA
jgi:hypothetical protein